jgi:hypothetical protein
MPDELKPAKTYFLTNDNAELLGFAIKWLKETYGVANPEDLQYKPDDSELDLIAKVLVEADIIVIR